MKTKSSIKVTRRGFLIGGAVLAGGAVLYGIVRILEKYNIFGGGPDNAPSPAIQSRAELPSVTATGTTARTATSTTAPTQTPRVFTEDAPVDFKYYSADTPVTQAGGAVITQTHRYKLNGPIAYGENGAYSIYNGDKTKSYPLIVSLHASGAPNSEEAQAQGKLGDGRPFASIAADLPPQHDPRKLPGYFEYSPICPPPYTESGGPSAPEGGEWNSPAARQMITAAIQDLMRRFNIDPDRIYLFGFSMGGAGVRYIAQEWYRRTGIPVAAILINAGYTPDDKMIGYVQGTPGTPPGPVVWKPENNQFPDLCRSAVWYHVGGEDTMGRTGDAIGNRDLAVCTYNMLKLQLPGGSETVGQRGTADGTLWPTGGHSSLLSDLATYALDGKKRFLLSVYQGGGHELFMGANPDLFEWLFNQRS